ncbi:MAG TPA: excinuclease ABC subunit C [Porphyromonadaceae bacterium]|nr:excinuclease ABC subunit C [Porphyromonadaceae bacterium]
MRDELKLKISLLPDSPGVYRYKNRDGVIIYVGKAKNLKRRVNSYFNREHSVLRTNMLVRNIWDMEYTVVNTEEEALDLENSLIKEFQPHYNVLLKDDKSYPWICVTKELYPRVFVTRDALKRGAKYYGPYPHAEVAHTLLDVIRQIYPLRTCTHNVSRETIEQLKHRLCLQYHIKRCEGCCRGLVTVEQYGRYIEEIKQILNGDVAQLSEYLVTEMNRLASELRFEEAEVLKRKYRLIERVRARSVIVNPNIHNIDVLTLIRDDQSAYFNYMHMRGGSVVQALTLEYRLPAEDTPDDELMSMAVNEMHRRFAETYERERVRETLVNIIPDVEFEGMEFVIPQRGDKRRLLEISLKNAEQYKTEKYKRMEKLNPEQRTTRTLTAIQRDFHLTSLPRHMECFDNSNISGTHPVASCVVFRNAKPAKKDYRHFNIKTVEGPDDFASMREVITRRYSRLVAEGAELPQLIVLDGGKGQLSSAVEALDGIGLRGKIAVVGIAKRLDEIFFPGDSVPLYIDKNSETLRVVQRMRDEAHRFAIAHHRQQRGKGQTHSILDDIKGVGPATKQLLLKHFKSLKRIREASVEDLAAVIGEKKGEMVFNYLKSNE